MCAYVNIECQNKFLKKHKNHKTVSVYKYLIKDGNKLTSPFYYEEYKPGIIQSNSKAELQTKNGKEINRGIHTYLSSQKATDSSVHGDAIVKFEANIEDLICIGYDDEAVFTKVSLSKSEYEKAING